MKRVEFFRVGVLFLILVEGQPLFPDEMQVIEELSALTIQNKKVVLSPGHGWYDTGTGTWKLQRGYWWGIVEDFVNAEITMLVHQKLQGSGADLRPVRQMSKSAGNHSSGYPWWQMDASEYVRHLGAPWSIWNGGFNGIDRDIVARPEYANWIGANAFITVHNNGGGGCGTETWYDTTNGYSTESKKLADLIQNKLIQQIRAQWNPNWCNRGVKGAAGNYGEIRRFLHLERYCLGL